MTKKIKKLVAGMEEQISTEEVLLEATSVFNRTGSRLKELDEMRNREVQQ